MWHIQKIPLTDLQQGSIHDWHSDKVQIQLVEISQLVRTLQGKATQLLDLKLR